MLTPITNYFSSRDSMDMSKLTFYVQLDIDSDYLISYVHTLPSFLYHKRDSIHPHPYTELHYFRWSGHSTVNPRLDFGRSRKIPSLETQRCHYLDHLTPTVLVAAVVGSSASRSAIVGVASS